MNNTVETFLEAKKTGKKLTMLTAYDYAMAKLFNDAGVNSILIGDSLGMVFMGHKNTLAVTIDDIIYHTKAVLNGAPNALIMADMPFMSYQSSTYDAVVNAGRLVKEGGAHCVKLEGGFQVVEHISKIVDASIPVCAHIGLTPQSVNAMGGFKVQGKSYEAAEKIVQEAIAVEQAGAFAVVLECVPAKLAELISQKISIPTIGIGAGAGCDGQVLVYQDMLGMLTDFVPKFVKKYADLATTINGAVGSFIEEVEAGTFPEEKHSFKIDDEIIEKLRANV